MNSLLLKRLEILKLSIQLDDDLSSQIIELQKYSDIPLVEEILSAIKVKELAQAQNIINLIFNNENKLISYSDVEILNINNEIRRIEFEIQYKIQQYYDIEKELHQYHHTLRIHFGDIIQKILELKRNIALRSYKRSNANSSRHKEYEDNYYEKERAYRGYSEDLKKENDEFDNLSDEEKKLIKRLFRQASFLCHPDKVNSENHDKAAEIFNQLKIAYDKNDLNTVQKIYNDLSSGQIHFKEEVIHEVKILKSKLESLKQKYEEWEVKVKSIQSSQEYIEYKSIVDFDSYYSRLNDSLKNELHRLLNEWDEGSNN